MTGSTPGSARSTGEAWVLGAAPNAVDAPEKIFERVASCTWVSSPITTSQFITVRHRHSVRAQPPVAGSNITG
jgi:hypothetical protein